MEKIPTAEEFLQNYKNDTDHYADQDYSEERLIKALREFAKLHVEAALKEASEKYWIDATTGSNSIQGYKDLILNSYPLENIK